MKNSKCNEADFERNMKQCGVLKTKEETVSIEFFLAFGFI